MSATIWQVAGIDRNMVRVTEKNTRHCSDRKKCTSQNRELVARRPSARDAHTLSPVRIAAFPYFAVRNLRLAGEIEMRSRFHLLFVLIFKRIFATATPTGATLLPSLRLAGEAAQRSGGTCLAPRLSCSLCAGLAMKIAPPAAVFRALCSHARLALSRRSSRSLE